MLAVRQHARTGQGKSTLRLHALMGDQFTDIEPARDLMVAFPSWMPHEVMPVSVPDE